MEWNPMVPELSVADLAASLRFYVDVVGFTVLFERTDPPFAYLDLAGAQLMLEEDHDGAWRVAPIEPPRGRGINLQIEVPDVHRVQGRLLESGVSLFGPLREGRYETSEGEFAQLELLVQDPDGYLLRFVGDVV